MHAAVDRQFYINTARSPGIYEWSHFRVYEKPKSSLKPAILKLLFGLLVWLMPLLNGM